MVRNKTSHFAFDWWIIQKRFVYLVIAIFMLSGLAAGAAVYVWKYGNPFKNVAELKNPAGARFMSFEGDVRVIRASTREMIPAKLSFTPATQCKRRPMAELASVLPTAQPCW